jgi:hypothetical protein
MAISLLEMKTQFPDPFRQGVVSLLWENSRIMPLLNFIEFKGLAYPYSAVAKLPGIGFRNANAQFTDTQSVINPAVETLAILGGRIKADTVLNEVKGDAFRQGEITRQLEAAGKFFDKAFINGDPAVTDGAFMGLKPRIVAGSQLLTPAAGVNGNPVTMDDVIRLQDAVEGDNKDKVLLMNRTLRRNLSHDVGKSAGGRNVLIMGTGQQETGLQVGIAGSPWTTFNGSKVQEVFFDEAENPILPFTEVSGSSGATCSSVYCVRFGNSVDERYVQGISGLPGNFKIVGPINFGEYMIDVVQALMGIGIFSGYAVARLQGVNATPS